MGEASPRVGDDADRNGHQWYSVQLAAAILAEKIARPPVLLGVLIRDQRVEDRHDLAAHFVDGEEGNDENEVVPADVPHEPGFADDALHDVAENLCEDANDAVALAIRVAVVEFLEVIEIR